MQMKVFNLGDVNWMKEKTVDFIGKDKKEE